MKLLLILLLCGTAQAADLRPYSMSTASGDATYVNVAGDTMTGQLTTASTITVQGNAFSVGGSALVVKEGKVGVGTASPSTNFVISSPASFAIQRILAPSGQATRIDFGTTGGTEDNGRVAYNNSTGELAFVTAKLDRLTVASGGAVAVPYGSFSVGTSTLVVTGGRVGIGIVAPLDDVHHRGLGAIRSDGGTATDYVQFGWAQAGMRFYRASVGTMRLDNMAVNGANAALTIRTSNASALDTTAGVILGNGKWGIGTTAPANTLHVKGTTGIAVSSAPLAGLSMVFRGMEAKANITATDPVAAGELWLCTDCTAPYSLCVSTGTAVADYAKMGTTDACN